MIAPVQDRIPIYIAAIGPKNTTADRRDRRRLAAHLLQPRARGRLARAARRRAPTAPATASRSTTRSTSRPMVNVSIDDDLDRARDSMRPVLALYVGGMGSREKNFYNAIVQRYGFEDAAKEVQDLYLDGKKDEAAAALPAELIDMVSLCGPKDRVAERLEVYRDAGVGHADLRADGVRLRLAPPDGPRPGRDGRLTRRSCSPPSATRGTPSRRSPWAASWPRAGTRCAWRPGTAGRTTSSARAWPSPPRPSTTSGRGRGLTPYQAAVRAARRDGRADRRASTPRSWWPTS